MLDFQTNERLTRRITELEERLATDTQRAEEAGGERKLYWECYARSLLVYRWMRGFSKIRESRLARVEEALRESAELSHGKVKWHHVGTFDYCDSKPCAVAHAALPEKP